MATRSDGGASVVWWGQNRETPSKLSASSGGVPRSVPKVQPIGGDSAREVHRADVQVSGRDHAHGDLLQSA
eukprot:1176912-Prorocentrum_minimum.AAC.4